jgi:hypothetical protein
MGGVLQSELLEQSMGFSFTISPAHAVECTAKAQVNEAGQLIVKVALIGHYSYLGLDGRNRIADITPGDARRASGDTGQPDEHIDA